MAEMVILEAARVGKRLFVTFSDDKVAVFDVEELHARAMDAATLEKTFGVLPEADEEDGAVTAQPAQGFPGPA